MLLLALACLTNLDLKPGDPALETGEVVGHSGETGSAVTDLDGDGVPDDEDCDDADADVYPGADELCDGEDQDCDGQVDEQAVDLETWYVDGDTDGFGATPVSACTQPSDAVAVKGDCDDSDASVNPDALEICFDLVDNDCDGDVDEEDAGCVALELTEGSCVDLHAALGAPTQPVQVQVTVPAAVTITCHTTGQPALTTGALPEGSTVWLVNEGTLHGHGGDGACAEQGAGETGGDALHVTVDVIIANTGGLYGGGGGGGSGDDPKGGGGGAGGGLGCDGGGDSSGGDGGHGSTRWGHIPGGQGAHYDGSPGIGGQVGNPATAGGGGSGGGAQTISTTSGEGQGGAGGGWGGGGGGGSGIRQDRNMGNGGYAGYAVRVIAGSVSFTSGDDTDHVKGAVQ